ncbi:myelin-associated glycoprotein-like [Cyprinus carpio]|uniref:Myelin-associated glycoprotein-like n=1 Tax=Cyprinus carpio TaxID=7962 RepID=A0A9Q9ZYI5_CYPCA|nr:myelin-associated glycoprotein-like [Cyprinus carpio]
METLVTFLLIGSLIQGVFCVYSVNLPQRVEALQGSCVFIPCTFDIDQQLNIYLTNNAKRKWLTSSTLVFDSSSPNTGLLKGEIFGTATQKNCTTRFDNVSQSHNGSYYFRLESSSALQYSYLYSQVQIAVLGSPPKPTLRVFKDQQELMKMMEVIEGSSVNLRCSTKIFCPSRPPSLRWSSSLNENVTEKQYQNQSEFISDLNLTVSHRHHRVTFSCTATHQLQQPITTQESWMLLVQYAPRNTSVTINPAGLVLEDRSVTLSCSSNANPAVNYTWYRDTNGLLNPVQTGPNLTINDTDSTHRGRYYCTAENKRGTQNISVLLDVQYAPKNTSLSAFPSSSVMEGKPVTLNCSTDANPAELNYTWYRETGSQFELLQTGYNQTYIVTNPTHGAWYGCNAQNQYGQCNTTIQLDVQFAPKISSSCSRNSAIVCVCEARGNPCPTLEWRLSGQALANSTETSISVETLGSTGVKSVLTTHRSLTDVLQCFSANIYGSSSQFQPIPPPQEPSEKHKTAALSD